MNSSMAAQGAGRSNGEWIQVQDASWTTGQKTGFFIDQRDNRKLLGQYTQGKSVLNMFGYTGGFSVYAMKNASTGTYC